MRRVVQMHSLVRVQLSGFRWWSWICPDRQGAYKSPQNGSHTRLHSTPSMSNPSVFNFACDAGVMRVDSEHSSEVECSSRLRRGREESKTAVEVDVGELVVVKGRVPGFFKVRYFSFFLPLC
jgi:hypothetical protein